jgi:hypothetical protein
MFTPSISIDPLLMGSTPNIVCSISEIPEPFSPVNPTTSPLPNRKVNIRKALAAQIAHHENRLAQPARLVNGFVRIVAAHHETGDDPGDLFR